ncbi:ComEA family DNA-binding protein [Paenibacillus radicis (ex Gao et al. 2016)]|uniref:Helix-hairpin-helix DNA-binding motif class 1 domain-containing protein n=1 Tax=Paenibacillus radicis (ex Gao et al. 2016) TaxID=1737354 RepID=A0A917GSU9_9BACL|nr:ComEA family DNA-binding protein [Paenibacillus radicis (ex Gao et al. 2016)]GGG55954.1 hypothetical protein GCM10010918_06090 [Paenibacillus radicis (ex Gao et al. 2016)]
MKMKAKMIRGTERTKMYILAALFVLAAVMFTVAFAMPKEEMAKGWEPLNRPVEQALLELEAGAGNGGAQAGTVVEHQDRVKGQSGNGEKVLTAGKTQTDLDELPNTEAGTRNAQKETNEAGQIGTGGTSSEQSDVAGAGGKGTAGQAAGDGQDGAQQTVNGQANSNSGTAEIADADRGKLDINRATLEQLKGLKGIGPAKAQAIVNEREQRGFFNSADDLLRVKGIGPKLLAGLKDSIVARP